MIRTTLLMLGLCVAVAAQAQRIGEVDTVFKLIGPDHKIVVDAYDDPKVSGVTCYVSRAKTGGISGGLGLAEDTADASIACRQVRLRDKLTYIPIFNFTRSTSFGYSSTVRSEREYKIALV